MESHVTGGITPLSLGELRQALLTVVVGNPHFSPAEQLLTNHQAYDTTCPQQLAGRLYHARHEAARRACVADLQTLAQQELAFADYTTQRTDLLVLAHYPALHHDVARTLPSLLEMSTQAGRLDVMGLLYQMVLKHRGLLSQVLN